MFGHSHPEIIQAIEPVTKAGFTLGGTTRKEQELAKLLVSRFPSMDSIRFCNSGTEANTLALATALAHTGRRKVCISYTDRKRSCVQHYERRQKELNLFASFYRSWSSKTAITAALSPFPEPTPMLLPHKFVYGTFNDIERNRNKIDIEVGAILVEPMQGSGGMIPAREEFLQVLCDEATRIGAILIFDEVITSRLFYGGLQEHLGITPDITTIGKHFGGGFSLRTCETHSYWTNAQVQANPVCIYQPGAAADVSLAVITLHHTNCQFAVKSGGHGRFEGESSISDGVTIGLARINQSMGAIIVPRSQLGPGNRWIDVYTTTQGLGITVVGGRAASVGVGGFLPGDN